MKIKSDKNLEMLAKAAGRTTEETSQTLIRLLLGEEIICDIEDYYGCKVGEATSECGILVRDVWAMISALGIERVTDKIFDAFRACVVMGEGDCPECGGWLEMYDEINNGKHPGSPEFVCYSELYRCPCCERHYELDKMTHRLEDF